MAWFAWIKIHDVIIYNLIRFFYLWIEKQERGIWCMHKTTWIYYFYIQNRAFITNDNYRVVLFLANILKWYVVSNSGQIKIYKMYIFSINIYEEKAREKADDSIKFIFFNFTSFFVLFIYFIIFFKFAVHFFLKYTYINSEHFFFSMRLLIWP